jgi:DNA ligase D-like protein (predicted 3'-phosphoesterase)
VRFVVQQHHATSRHYDFRLEQDGVFKSWAVPKGPSYDPAEKRLAMEVEDHPLSWGDFEGVIPKRSYGAGPVIVWDRGTWRPLSGSLEEGQLSFWLEGEKLVGGWALRRWGGERKWLLIKKRDEEAAAGRELAPESVVSGRTIEELQ